MAPPFAAASLFLAAVPGARAEDAGRGFPPLKAPGDGDGDDALWMLGFGDATPLLGVGLGESLFFSKVEDELAVSLNELLSGPASA